eukprot:CAMPEP_0176144616 /NCGR_PEP_ID=MMETSP0120_2-20121206/73643_1 /TAXON_ID=160619 /ORGANISM="Kryptoperidinium foliaceum, Strain CCMP 1326" /LENGTH=88 /DNA_ID=CAMNT_0017481019 /DNA_START=762 /DNA_END=1029 /DNA_ORIENTATION=-
MRSPLTPASSAASVLVPRSAAASLWEALPLDGSNVDEEATPTAHCKQYDAKNKDDEDQPSDHVVLVGRIAFVAQVVHLICAVSEAAPV